MGKINPNASQKTARRRVFNVTVHARDLTQDESIEWLNMLERLIGSGGKVARVIGVTPVTYSRWKNGKAPTAWWWRGVYANIFNEIATTLHKKDPATGRIPIQQFPDVHRRLKAARVFVETYLDASGAEYQVDISEGEALTRRHRVIHWLRNYMKLGKTYYFSDIRADGEEEGFDTAVINLAANFLKVRRKRQMVFDGDKPKGTTSKWTREIDVDMSLVDACEEVASSEDDG